MSTAPRISLPLCGALLATLATGLLFAAPADALTTVYTDRASFEAAAGPLFGEGFETSFTSAPSVDFGVFSADIGFGNVSSADAASLPQLVSEGSRSIYGFDGTQPSTIGNTMRFTFDTPIYAFGVDINDFSSTLIDLQGTGSEPLLITSLWNTATDGAPPSTIFFGVVDTVPFVQVAIFWNSNLDAVGFDDVSWATVVPEPTTGSLLLLGMGILAGTGRRLRA